MFNYKIIDNFLNKEDFLKLTTLNLEKINKNEIKIYHNKVFKNKTTQLECLEVNLIKKLSVMLKLFFSTRIKLFEVLVTLLC